MEDWRDDVSEVHAELDNLLDFPPDCQKTLRNIAKSIVTIRAARRQCQPLDVRRGKQGALFFQLALLSVQLRNDPGCRHRVAEIMRAVRDEVRSIIHGRPMPADQDGKLSAPSEKLP